MVFYMRKYAIYWSNKINHSERYCLTNRIIFIKYAKNKDKTHFFIYI